MDSERNNNFGITSSFTKLCELHLQDWKRVYVIQPKHSKDVVKRRLKKCLYDALFSTLRQKNRKNKVLGAKERILSYGLGLRLERNFDEASRLENLLEELIGKNDDTVEAALQFLSLLINTSNTRDTPTIGELGHKLPVIVMGKTAFPELPNGPREYGDTCFQKSDKHYFMHFPRAVFERGALVPDVQISKVCELSPGVGLTGTGYFSVQGNLNGGNEEANLAFFEGVNAGDLKLGNGDKTVIVREERKDFKDDGYLSNSNSLLSMSHGMSYGQSTDQDLDLESVDTSIWEKAIYHVPSKHFTWETRGQIPGPVERPYLSQAGSRAVEKIYDLFEGITMMWRVEISERQLVQHVKNLLLGIPSIYFQFDRVTNEFVIKEGLCVTGLTPYVVRHILAEFLQCGSQCHKLNVISRPLVIDSFYQKGLVFHAFTRGIYMYLQSYRTIIISLSTDNTLLKIKLQCQRIMKQMSFLVKLCEGCQLIISGAENPKECPYGSRLLSFLYKETINALNTDCYFVMLSLLKTCMVPFCLFIQDWLYHGICRDAYNEFLFNVTDCIWSRDKHYWREAFVLKDASSSETMPLFLVDTVDDIFTCGKSLNLLKVCKPQHFLCNVPQHETPKIVLSFSEEEMTHLATRCAIYVQRTKQIIHQMHLSREETKRRAEQMRLELIERAKAVRMQDISRYQAKVSAYRQAVDAKQRKEFKELKQQMEMDLQRRAQERAKEKADDKVYMDKVTRREEPMDRREAKLELQARLELINFYANLTEEAAHRERKALWKIQRARLATPRLEFLVQQEVAWRKELQESYKTKKIDSPDETDTLDTEDGGELPAWAEKGQDFVTVYVSADTDEDSALPNWASRGLRDASAPSLVLDVKTDDLPAWALKRLGSTPEIDDDDDPADLSVFHDYMAQDEEKATNTKLSPTSSKWRPQVKVMGDMLAESEEKIERLHIRMSDDTGVSKESESAGGDKPSITVIPGHHVSTESDEMQQKSTVQFNPNMHSTSETTETEFKPHIQQVGDKNVNQESEPSEGLIVPRLKRNPSQHVSVESAPASFKIKKASVFGHVSQLSNMEFIIAAPKLKPSEKMHAGKESDFKEYAIKPNIRLSEKSYACRESDLPGPSRLQIKVNKDRHVSLQSTFVDQEAARIDRFKEQNLYGHASDSSVEKILYGEQFGKSKDKTDGNAKIIDLVPIGQKFDLTLKQLPVEMYQDNFEFLNADPCGDLHLNLMDVSSGMADVGSFQGSKSYQYTSLRLMEASLKPHISAQVSLINGCVMGYFTDEMQIDQHFNALRRYLFMEDGEFGQALGEQLFEKLASASYLEARNPICLQDMLNRARRLSINPDDKYANNLAITLIDQTDNLNRTDRLGFFGLTYKVDWPLNIVITDTSLEKYSKIFNYLLQIRHSAWLLKGIWQKLKRDSNILKITNCPQICQLQFYRQEMQHFVMLNQGYIANQIINVTWTEFQTVLNENVESLDELVQAHRTFINTAVFRCLLTPNARSVMKVIKHIFQSMFNFYTLLHAASWQKNPTTGVATHPNFSKLTKEFEQFQQILGILFKAVSRLGGQGYQTHLKELLLRMNFNHYYAP